MKLLCSRVPELFPSVPRFVPENNAGSTSVVLWFLGTSSLLRAGIYPLLQFLYISWEPENNQGTTHKTMCVPGFVLGCGGVAR